VKYLYNGLQTNFPDLWLCYTWQEATSSLFQRETGLHIPKLFIVQTFRKRKSEIKGCLMLLSHMACRKAKDL
jgi:hypothetical protein